MIAVSDHIFNDLMSLRGLRESVEIYTGPLHILQNLPGWRSLKNIVLKPYLTLFKDVGY